MAMMEFRQAVITAGTQTPTPPPLKVEGYAIVFDTFAQVGDFEEKITRSALKKTDLTDVSLFYNHDLNRLPLARTPDTLKLTVDERGLKFSAVLPNTESGKEIYESIKRGDLRGCSFGFTIPTGGDKWQGNQRTITQIEKIFECSICPFPAYSETSVEARNKKTLEEKTMANDTNNTTGNENQFGENAKNLLRNVAGFSTVETIQNFDAENVLGTAEYRTAFYKNLQGKKLSALDKAALKVARENFEKRANEFNTSTNSAALIPTATLDEIISKARTQGGLLSECRGFSIPSNVAIPVATPKEKAAWHVEGASVDSEKIETTNLTFNGYEILKVFSMSLKTQAMTISAFESYLVDELRICVIETIENALINGTGNGQGTGLLSAFNSGNTIDINSPISYSSFATAIGTLNRGYSNGAKFAVNNKTLFSQIYLVKDNDNHPLFIQDLQNERIGRILGFPVVVDDHIPDNKIIFGNFQYMAYNLPSGIVIESSRESSFKSGLIDYRAIAIADCKPILSDAFIMLNIEE